MIRRLMLAARAEGLPADPFWGTMKGLVYDLDTRTIAEAEFGVVLPQRSGTLAHLRPGYLAEKASNLQPGSPFRNAQVALAERWAAETHHALPEAVASLLRSAAAIPDAPQWITFALRGQTCADVPELRALVAREAAPPLLAPEACHACGTVAPVVELHSGMPSMGNVAPVLVSWNRGGIVERYTSTGTGGTRRRQGGENLPTCVTCMYLYVQWLNKHTTYHPLTGGHSFVLDGERWTLSNNVRAGFVTGVMSDDPTTLLWERLCARQAGRPKMTYDREAIDRVAAQPRDPRYQMGYLYGMLEWATWVIGIGCPSLADVAGSPALHLSALIIAVRDGAERYTAPAKERGRLVADARPASTRAVVRTKLKDVLQVATAHISELLADPILPGDRPAFALGYAHSLTLRGPRSESLATDESGDLVINGHEPTPWARRLAYALQDRGVIVELEYRVNYERQGKPRHVRIDLAMPEDRLAIEVDGRLQGFSTRNHVTDSRKSAVLLAKGWRLHRVPNRRLNAQNDIDEVADEIMTILSANKNNTEKAEVNS